MVKIIRPVYGLIMAVSLIRGVISTPSKNMKLMSAIVWEIPEGGMNYLSMVVSCATPMPSGYSGLEAGDSYRSRGCKAYFRAGPSSWRGSK